MSPYRESANPRPPTDLVEHGGTWRVERRLRYAKAVCALTVMFGTVYLLALASMRHL